MDKKILEYKFIDDYNKIQNDEKSIEKIAALLNQSVVEPHNIQEATFLFMMLSQACNKHFQFKDFIAQALYVVNECGQEMSEKLENLSINGMLTAPYDETPNELDYDTFLFMSDLAKKTIKTMEGCVPEPRNTLRLLKLDDKSIDLLLHGEEEDWLEMKNRLANDSEDMNRKKLLFLTLFAMAQVEKTSIVKEMSMAEAKIMSVLALIPYTFFQRAKTEYPDDYTVWKNFVLKDFDYTFIQIDSNTMQEDGIAKALVLFTWVDSNYKNFLNNLFNVIYNNNYSEGYRTSVLQMLQDKDFNKPILPYYSEYCEKHNIDIESRIYLGDIPEINADETKNHDYVLSKIKQENPDPNVDGHFGLALDAETIEDIFNHLKGMYLSPDTDIWLFCYRLTGKGKPEKLLVINWIGGDKSLAFFINKLGLNKLYWKKISAFFNLSGKEIKESTLKSIHSRLFKPDGELDSDDKNTLQLKNILEKIIG